MELNEIGRELSQVERAIERAAQAIKEDDEAPQLLRDCVKELDKRSRTARQSRDAGQLMQVIDDMKAVSDRARTACEQVYKINAETRSAVREANHQLSGLKQLLH